jgi:hypothetical protein
MSIAVDLEDIPSAIATQIGWCYLLTVSDDGRAHSVAVPVRWDGDELVVPAGRTTSANAQARSLVALLWPPPERGGFSLIVDAHAKRVDDGQIWVEPTRAVLHRPAPSGDGNDCAPVL